VAHLSESDTLVVHWSHLSKLIAHLTHSLPSHNASLVQPFCSSVIHATKLPYFFLNNYTMVVVIINIKHSSLSNQIDKSVSMKLPKSQ